MSIVKLLDDYLLEHGNERFIEGWDGALEGALTELEYRYKQATEKSHGVFGDVWYEYHGLIQGLEIAMDIIKKRIT